MRLTVIPLATALLLLLPLAVAADAPPENAIVIPPDAPPPVIGLESEDEVTHEDPTVTIIQKEDATYEEYRVNGKLYMVKVIPVAGPAYYYVDRNGDGNMEIDRPQHRGWQVKVPQWVIFSW